MERHVIIGKGKIGTELSRTIQSHGHDAFVLSRSEGFEYPSNKLIDEIRSINPEYVWCAVGAGSVSECKANYLNAATLHEALPIDLCNKLGEKIKLVFFSTDYVACEEYPDDPYQSIDHPRSLYALSKLTMERAVKFVGRPNTVIFRIGNPYCNNKFYYQTLPGKIISNNKDKPVVCLPENLITPTPIPWLCNLLVKFSPGLFEDGVRLHHAAPTGSISVLEFGRLLFKEQKDFSSTGIDKERPAISRLDCSFAKVPSWEDLWGFTSYL